jgi:hypothetical protein
VSKDGRYDVSHLTEAQFEPGSNDLVLSNLRAIKSVDEMDEFEARALESAMSWLSLVSTTGTHSHPQTCELFTRNGWVKFRNGRVSIDKST